MKTLDKEQDKIEKICEVLRKETIEPAKEQAAKIIEEAKELAEQIRLESERERKTLLDKTKTEIEQERSAFQSALHQASKQSLEYLRQEIEQGLFNQELDHLIISQTQDPQVLATLIQAIVKAVEKEGLSADFDALIPENVNPRAVNQLLAQEVLKKLEKQSVTVGSFKGGAQVKLINRKMTIDISEKALKELLASFMRKDFRQLVFNV